MEFHVRTVKWLVFGMTKVARPAEGLVSTCTHLFAACAVAD